MRSPARTRGSTPGGDTNFFFTFSLFSYRNIALRVSSQRDKVQIKSVLVFISCYLQIQSTFICRQWICFPSEVDLKYHTNHIQEYCILL